MPESQLFKMQILTECRSATSFLKRDICSNVNVDFFFLPKLGV